MANFVQFRIFIGPPFLPLASPQRYDWSQINAGATLPATPEIPTTTQVTDASTAVVVASTANYPNTGGFWIGANGGGQAWEYISYSSKSSTAFTGLLREPISNREHNGIHSAGVPIRFWWPITSDDGKLHLVEEMDDNLATITWHADIGGVNIPQAAIRNHHLIVVQTRTSPAASFGNTLVGWLDQPRVSDDARHYTEWSARIVCSAEMVRRQELNGLQVGDLDMAQKGSAQGSTSLGSPYKERYSGDYIAANPSFDASMVIDDDPSTLWIAERYMGDDNTPRVNNDPMNPEVANTRFIFSEMYINPPAGQSGGRRWIQLTALTSANVTGYQILSATDYGESDFVVISPGQIDAGQHVLIVEDQDIFSSENPLHSEAFLYEKPSLFAHMSPTSGELSIRQGAINRWLTNVKWGDSSRYQHNVDGNAPNFWSGPRITAPGQGETMRYVYADPPGTPTSSQYWRTSNVQSSAYNIDTSPDQWVQLELGSIGLILRDDITATVPGAGAMLYINDASGPNTGGLAGSGTLQIGSEQISYSSKTAEGVVVSGRGVSGTTPAPHAAKDVVYIMDNGVATDAPPIKRISWTRQGGTIYPNNFHMKYSNLPANARTPDAGSDYKPDYVDLVAVNSYTSPTYTLTLSPAKRIKFLLLTIARMTANPGRPRVNTISALADEAYYNSNLWLTGAQTCGGIITRLLNNANIPNAAITIVTDQAAPSKTTLANADGWTLISDFCDYTGMRVSCGRDSKFTITIDTQAFWTAVSNAAAATWSQTTATLIEHIQQSHGGVNQVKLQWQSADGTGSGTVVFPASADTFGKVLELGPLIYASQAAAQQSAQRRYYMNKYPYTLHVDCADAQPSLRPATIHLLSWPLDPSMQALNRYYIAKSVDHVIEKNIWSTSIEDIQVDRTAGF